MDSKPRQLCNQRDKNADERAREFMSNIRARVALADERQEQKTQRAALAPLPPGRPAWLLAPGQRPRKRLYTGLILMPGQMVITL